MISIGQKANIQGQRQPTFEKGYKFQVCWKGSQKTKQISNNFGCRRQELQKRCDKLIVHDQIPFSGHPLDTRYEGWESDVGPMDFLELVFNKEAWDIAEASNYVPRTHETKKHYDISKGERQDFNNSLRQIQKQQGYPHITIRDYGDQTHPEEQESDMETRWLVDDKDEMDLRAMAFKRHRRIREDKVWREKQREYTVTPDYWDDVRFKFAREHYIDEMEDPEVPTREDLHNFITQNGELTDVNKIKQMWCKNKTVPKLDQIHIVNPYRQSDYYYDEVYTQTETVGEWLHKNGHGFWPGEKEPYEDLKINDQSDSYYRYRDSIDPFGLVDHQEKLEPVNYVSESDYQEALEEEEEQQRDDPEAAFAQAPEDPTSNIDEFTDSKQDEQDKPEEEEEVEEGGGEL